MPSASTLNINDGQATPVSHAFAPRSQVGPGNTVLVNDEASTSAGQWKISLGFSSANGSRKTDRVKIGMSMPIEATDADGITRVAYTPRFSCDVVLPEEMTQAERDDLAAFAANVIADTVINAYISDLDPMY